jgi:hypothetical protein
LGVEVVEDILKDEGDSLGKIAGAESDCGGDKPRIFEVVGLLWVERLEA